MLAARAIIDCVWKVFDSNPLHIARFESVSLGRLTKLS
jgi:hypothetical protein